jgi:hypothetical protein
LGGLIDRDELIKKSSEGFQHVTHSLYFFPVVKSVYPYAH